MEKENTYGFEMIHVEEIEEIRRRERTMLVDLRDERSYREGHIKNARNFPITYMEDWRKSIPEGIGLILYCEHGNQSLLAARKLRGRKGRLYTVTGGYQAWLRCGMEVKCNSSAQDFALAAKSVRTCKSRQEEICSSPKAN